MHSINYAGALSSLLHKNNIAAIASVLTTNPLMKPSHILLGVISHPTLTWVRKSFSPVSCHSRTQAPIYKTNHAVDHNQCVRYSKEVQNTTQQHKGKKYTLRQTSMCLHNLHTAAHIHRHWICSMLQSPYGSKRLLICCDYSIINHQKSNHLN